MYRRVSGIIWIENGRNRFMTLLNYKEFMEDARMRLRNLTADDLRDLILNWASEEHPSKRQEFG